MHHLSGSRCAVTRGRFHEGFRRCRRRRSETGHTVVADISVCHINLDNNSVAFYGASAAAGTSHRQQGDRGARWSAAKGADKTVSTPEWVDTFVDRRPYPATRAGQGRPAASTI